MVWSAKRKYTKKMIWAITEREKGKKSPVDCALCIEIRRRRPREAGIIHMRRQEHSSGEPGCQNTQLFLQQIVSINRREHGDKPIEGHKEQKNMTNKDVQRQTAAGLITTRIQRTINAPMERKGKIMHDPLSLSAE
jgi:hypothetical protein